MMDPNIIMQQMQQRKNPAGSTLQNEFLLQGSVLDDSRDALLQKLRGFCDNSDLPVQTFTDHEMVFVIKLNSAGVTPGASSTLRVRRSLDSKQLDNPWNLRYLGHNDTDRNRLAMARTCIDCNTTSNIPQFLFEMGFRLDFEFVLRGFIFRKGRMKILVYKMLRIKGGSGLATGTLNSNANLTDSLEPLTPSHLIELSVVAPSYQVSIAEEMKQFADLLKPLVVLENIDMRKIN